MAVLTLGDPRTGRLGPACDVLQFGSLKGRENWDPFACPGYPVSVTAVCFAVQARPLC